MHNFRTLREKSNNGTRRRRPREKKTLFIVGTMFCLYRPSAAHTPCSDLLLFEVLWEENNFVGPHMYAKYGKKQLKRSQHGRIYFQILFIFTNTTSESKLFSWNGNGDIDWKNCEQMHGRGLVIRLRRQKPMNTASLFGWWDFFLELQGLIVTLDNRGHPLKQSAPAEGVLVVQLGGLSSGLGSKTSLVWFP